MKCEGHPAHTELAEPVFHLGFMPHLRNLLLCVCLRCSKLLVEFITGIIGYTHFGNEDEYTISNSDIVISKKYEMIEKLPFQMPDLCLAFFCFVFAFVCLI